MPTGGADQLAYLRTLRVPALVLGFVDERLLAPFGSSLANLTAARPPPPPAAGAGLLGEAATGAPPAVHPANISRNWSVLYVWLQYLQWYKVLSWLLVLVLGGSEGVLPPTVREAFRVEELLLEQAARRVQADDPVVARVRDEVARSVALREVESAAAGHVAR